MSTLSLQPRSRPRPLAIAGFGVARGPALATRPRERIATRLSGALKLDFLDVSEAEAVGAAWRALAADALDSNIFYDPALAVPAARHLPGGRDVRFLFVRDPALPRGDDLIGCFPLTGWRTGLWRGWSHPQSASGAPLVRSGRELEAIEALLSWAAERAAAVRFPLVALDGPFHRALCAVLARQDLAPAVLDEHRRALLRPGASAPPGKGRLKEWRRLARRLAEQGAVRSEAATSCPDVSAAAERFLALEASGWKGRRGTAFLRDAARTAFFRATMRSLAADGQVEVVSLSLDGAPVAMGVLLRAGRRGAFWKIAYDERFAAYSPGVQLTLALGERAAGRLDAVDSCAVAEHPMIDALWTDRLRVGDVLAPVSARSRLAFRLLHAREAGWLALRQGAKRLLRTVTGR